MEEKPELQIRIRLTTRDPNIAISDKPILVPGSLKRYGLSEIVNHLLGADEIIPFEFLINGKEILRTSLENYLVKNGLSAENLLEIEYTKSILPPSYLASFLQDDWISSVDIFNDNSKILSGSYDGIARIWDLSGNVEKEFIGHENSVLSAKWISNERIVTAGIDRDLRLWKVSTMGTIAILKGHTAPVNNISTDKSTNRILSASSDGSVRIWSTNPKEGIEIPLNSIDETSITSKRRRKATQTENFRGPLAVLTPNQIASNKYSDTDKYFPPVFDVTFANDSTIGYSTGQDHTIRTWDLTTGLLVSTRNVGTGFGSLLSIESLNKLNLIATGSTTRQITIHDPREYDSRINIAPVAILNGHSGFVSSISQSPESDFIFASASHDGTVRIWDIRTVSSQSNNNSNNNNNSISGSKSNSACLYVIRREHKADQNDVFSVDWDRKVGIVSGGKDKHLQINRGSGLENNSINFTS